MWTKICNLHRRTLLRGERLYLQTPPWARRQSALGNPGFLDLWLEQQRLKYQYQKGQARRYRNLFALATKVKRRLLRKLKRSAR